jgi:plastocyanin
MAGQSRTVSRRDFLTGTGAAALSAGATGAAGAQQTRTIEMTDSLVFNPDDATVPPGTTVVWENVGGIGHSVTAYEEDIPADAEYFASGGFDDEGTARNSYAAGDPDSGDVGGGATFEHTFEVEGEYGYFCVPHESAGMVASLTVGTDGENGDGGDGGGEPRELPELAVTVAVFAGAAFLAVLVLAYVFLKYQGDYGPGGEQ